MFSGYIYYLISEAVFLAVCWQDIRRKLGTDWDEMLCLRDKKFVILGLELNPLCCKLIEMHVFVLYSHQNCHVSNNSCIRVLYLVSVQTTMYIIIDMCSTEHCCKFEIILFALCAHVLVFIVY